MIIPSSRYPAQVAVDLTNYPRGKARNVTVSGDLTGTPFEKDWINDVWGGQQALMAAAGLTPSGVPDNAVTSDQLNALRVLMQQKTIGSYTLTSGVRKNNGQAYSLSLRHSYGGFTISGGNSIVVPVAGYYKVSFNGFFDASSAVNGTFLAATIYLGGTDTTAGGGCFRYSTNPGDFCAIGAESVFQITAPGSQAISLVSLTANMQNSPATIGTLIVERVG